MNTLACDFGGTRIKLGLVRDGAVVGREAIPALADRPLHERLESVAASLTALCATHGVPARSCAGIALSYPSVIDTANALILDNFGKFGDASALDLRAWAERTFGLLLAIDNDARMALIGEWRYGAGRGCDNVVMITLGTGVGTAVVMEGRVLRGAHGQAGILGGHLTVQHGGHPCVCGNLGCAEAEASTWALKELARTRPDFAGSALAREPVLDYTAVFRHAAAGDGCAQALKEHSLQVWSAAAVNLIHAYDPELLILGGGIMASTEMILPPLREYIDRHTHTPWGRVHIAVSELGDNAALVAGEWLVLEQLSRCD